MKSTNKESYYSTGSVADRNKGLYCESCMLVVTPVRPVSPAVKIFLA